MPQSQAHLHFRTPRPTNPAAPLFIYLPGMDGTGQLLSRQLAGLEQGFDIRCLAIAFNDLSGWEQLTQQVAQLVETELASHPRRQVYLCGESFGGCLALKLILHSPHLFDYLVLINPASSFSSQPFLHWSSYLVHPLPEPLHRLSCLGFLPFLAALERMIPNDRAALLEAMRSVSQNTTVWRVSLLRDFQLDEAKLERITQPTLIIASQADRLLPSVLEAKRLMAHIANAQIHVLPNSGHACLLETDIDLYEIMHTSGFLKRTLLATCSDAD
ncbi:MAG: alpha/beta fold hydrolase [Elainellaceae cyanobacterium]